MTVTVVFRNLDFARKYHRKCGTITFRQNTVIHEVSDARSASSLVDAYYQDICPHPDDRKIESILIEPTRTKLFPFQQQMAWEAERIKRQEQIVAGPGYRLLTWDETLQATDETVCVSTLYSGHEDWTLIDNPGQTVEEALKDDVDAKERMYRRKR